MRPPSPSMMMDTIIIRLAAIIDDVPAYADPGITLKANVSAPETGQGNVADQAVAKPRARVMTWTNPTGTDPAGVYRMLRKGDRIDWQGEEWIALGPMNPESKDLATGTPVNYRFDMERAA